VRGGGQTRCPLRIDDGVTPSTPFLRPPLCRGKREERGGRTECRMTGGRPYCLMSLPTTPWEGKKKKKRGKEKVPAMMV